MKKTIIITLTLILVLLISCEHKKEVLEHNNGGNISAENNEKDYDTDCTVNNEMSLEDKISKYGIPLPDGLICLPEEYLPKADEDTIKIAIEFPEDFSVGTYTAPNIVSQEEFEWGDYIPFVKFGVSWTRTLQTIYSCAFLTEEVKTIEQGEALYNKLNEKYKTSYPVIEGTLVEGKKISANTSSIFSKMLFESKIVNVSEDLNRIGTFYYQYEDSVPPTQDFFYSVWSTKYTIYENEIPIKNYNCRTEELRQNLPPHDFNFDCFFWNNGIQYGRYSTEYFKDFIVYLTSNGYNIFSLGSGKMIYEIKINNVPQETYYDFYDFVAERYLVIAFSTRINTTEGYPKFPNSTYIYDIKTQKLTHAENYAYQAKLSPDGKYFAYSNNNWENTDLDQPEGFYIKNLSNNTTVYYKSNYDSFVSAIVDSFVRKSDLLNKINAMD